MEKKLKVLYVDDELINRYIISRVLGEAYEVITVEGGEEALNKLEQDAEITYVISDLRMPKMTGLEFIAEAHKRFEGKKYFLLSGHSMNEEIKAALDANFIADYFEKPADFKRIDAALKAD